ncbi:hypothetical protein BaRGS_00021781 [Batillaria attramentaria]|uniref:Uncharacterized protein n=1 Tax=Batillaria attramentaria TaxID=370345 RepID=A0ABD0KIV2_9CAEN
MPACLPDKSTRGLSKTTVQTSRPVLFFLCIPRSTGAEIILDRLRRNVTDELKCMSIAAKYIRERLKVKHPHSLPYQQSQRVGGFSGANFTTVKVTSTWTVQQQRRRAGLGARVLETHVQDTDC